MKVCLFSPYFPDHFGGGERHLLDIATHLPSELQVVIAFPKRNSSPDEFQIRQQYERFYGASLARVSFVASPIKTTAGFLEKLLWTKQFSYLFAVSDGSLFFSLAKKNIVHLQIPFASYPSGVLNRLKLRFWELNTNSEFTKSVIEKSWNKEVSSVLQPMVASELFSLNQQKEKIILHVGRFFTQLHSKRQDILVANFRLMREQHPATSDWKLVLVGTVENSDYLDKIRRASADLPIEIKTSCSRQELLELYAKASIYWHATGFGVDESAHPEQVEHFGITTVEAMAAGAVPVVVAKGGQREVLGSELQSLNWETQEDCASITSKLIANPSMLQKHSSLAIERAKVFGEERFTNQVRTVFAIG
ncbi:MAG: glycosyltransferase [bacterium]|nr:glycosyltransferase [bacterium]